MALEVQLAMRTVRLPSGKTVPALGQGTWGIAEDPRRCDSELASLRTGFELGMTVVDTAKMYADGEAEKLVGEAIEGRRDEIFVVSKVLLQNASRRGMMIACECSLRRLRTDHDFYLLHWRGRIPLQETLDGFGALLQAGKVRVWGVSNFDVSDMKGLSRLPGGGAVTTDQVLYNLARRGIEYDLMPFCRELGIPIMAYSPIEQGRVLGRAVLRRIAERHTATTAQVALAWLLRQGDVVAIPKASDPAHTRANHRALEVESTDRDLGEIDVAFPPPTSPQPLEML